MSDSSAPRVGTSSPERDEAGSDRELGLRAGPEIVAVAVVAVVVGVVTRVVSTSALWLDEALSVDIARLPIGDIPDALRRDGHPPAYYVLLHGWTELFGTGDVAVRALSGAFGVVTLVLVWFLGRRRGGPRLGWILVAIVAVSPFAVRYSNETRMYSMVMLLVVVGWFLLDDIVVRGRSTPLRHIGLALVAAALLYTHYWSLWLLGAVGLCAVWALWRRPDERRLWIGVVLALGTGMVLFLPWVPTMLHQGAHTGTPWAPPMRPTSAVSVTLADYAGGAYGEQALFAVLLGTTILLGVFGAARGPSSIELDLLTRPQVRREAIVAALTVVIGTAAGYVLRGAYASRYSSVIFPLVMVLAAAGLTRFAARWIRFGVVVALVGALAIGAVWTVTYDRTQSRTIGAAITDRSEAGDVLVVCPDQLGPSINREIPDGVRVVTFPDGGDGMFVDWVDYADRNAASDPAAFARTVVSTAGSHTIWYMWNSAYKTLETQCIRLFDALAADRPVGIETIIADDGAHFFEHASLTRFPAPS